MAVNPVYFQVLSPQQANPFGYGMQQGAQTANQMQEAKMRALQNQMTGAQLPYAGDMAQADLALKQAQVPYMNSQTAMNMGTIPYLGVKYMAPMIAAQAKSSQAATSNSNAFRAWAQTPQGAAFIAQHPEMAETIGNAMQNSAGMINSGIGYNAAPSYAPQNGNYTNPSSLPVLPGGNNSPPQQNTQNGLPISPQEVNQLRNLAQPGIPQAPSDVQAIQNASQMLSQKKTTDASARQKNLYAANIDKTLATINPDDLTQYAGSPISKLFNQAAAPLGMESKNYDNYLQAANSAKLLAKQVRQFYGDSIQPSVGKELEQLADPATWQTNPALAKSLFNNFKGVLQQETGTYRDAMQSTAPYRAQGNSPLPAPSQSKVIGGKTYHKIDNQWYAQ